MKQSAAKTLGAAALGAAFAAAGAGAANAAPVVPDAAPALDSVTRAVPAGDLSGALPAEQPAVGGQAAGLLGGLPLEGVPTQGSNINGIPLG
ncbi:ATP-binding protein [Streptomyces sp. Tu 3180]|uniref:ATP-binding protein n=1 Tax=Streptomyces sp. Tu 3180 TaxID=2682611 RepID=UPI00135CB5B0|nr:ATP-binding protein [Streptomyces sp. Tu 3180]KAF3467169.1 ATP-binding protein [Streptomyces sp. Tu 3180]